VATLHHFFLKAFFCCLDVKVHGILKKEKENIAPNVMP
jgi:hypothetical protein